MATSEKVGTTTLFGTGTPSGSTGAISDIFIATDTGKIYKKTATSTWTVQATIGLLKTTSVLGANDVDWSLQGPFEKTITGNTTLTFSNAVDGQTIVLHVLSTGAFTLALPTILWPGGVVPTMTSGNGKRDTFTVIKDGANLVGSYVQDTR